VTRDEVKTRARELLGPTGTLSGVREWGMLARLLAPGEEIEAMALGKLRGRAVAAQRFLVATPARLLVLEKGFFTGRERLRELAWGDVAGVELPSDTRLVLRLRAGEAIELTLAYPPRALARFAEVVRAATGPAGSADLRTTAAELLELARRRLGRLWGTGTEPVLFALAEALEPDEQVLDLAAAADGLLAATTARLVFVGQRRLRASEPEAVPYAELRSVELDAERALVAEGIRATRRWGPLFPDERAAALAERAAARVRR
jgi:hypothetical protein